MCRTFYLWPLWGQQFLGREPKSYTTDPRLDTLMDTHDCSTGGPKGYAMVQSHRELSDGLVGGAVGVSWDKFASAGFWGRAREQLLGK